MDERLPFHSIRADFVVDYFFENSVLMFGVHTLHLPQGAAQVDRFHGDFARSGVMAFLGDRRRPFQAFGTARVEEFAEPTLGGKFAQVFAGVLRTAEGFANNVGLIVLGTFETVDQKLPEINFATFLAARERGRRFSSTIR
jgi:hypothetical protein